MRSPPTSPVEPFSAPVHLVLCDFGKLGSTYVETEPVMTEAAVVANRSCPVAWCNWRRVTAITGMSRAGRQPARAGRPTAGSSLSGAIVSSVI